MRIRSVKKFPRKRPTSRPDASLPVNSPQHHAGSMIFSNRVWTEIAKRLNFTGRELQIVRGVFDDRTEFAIAADLGISPHTVHTHIERMRRKLSVGDRATLILCVMETFLALTAAPRSAMPPICGLRSAGLCHRRD